MRKAFTFIELCVVLMVISILVALLIPAINKVKAAAMRVETTNKIKGILDSIKEDKFGFKIEENDTWGTPLQITWTIITLEQAISLKKGELKSNPLVHDIREYDGTTLNKLFSIVPEKNLTYISYVIDNKLIFEKLSAEYLIHIVSAGPDMTFCTTDDIIFSRKVK